VGTAAPPRIVAYGDSLTAGSPSMEPYAKAMAQALWDAGIQVEVTVCGLNAMRAEQMLALAEEPDVHDMMSRWGHGLAHLIRPKRGAWKAADLVLIMAGTNDLGQASARPNEICAAVRGLHELCHAEGVRTVALAIPDAGGAVDSMTMVPDIRGRRRAANAAIAAWSRSSSKDDLPCNGLVSLTRPELFVSIGALMPYGPLARAAGFWEKDGVHFTAAGSRVLGQRLAFKLQGLVSELQRSRLREGRGLPTIEDDGAAGSTADSAPTLEAYLAAFALEDAAAIKAEAVEEQQEVPDWELDAVSFLQAWHRGKRNLSPSGQVRRTFQRLPRSKEAVLSTAVSQEQIDCRQQVLAPASAAPPVTAASAPPVAASSPAAADALPDACAAITAAAASGDAAALKDAIALAKKAGVPKKEIARANALGQH